MIAPTEMKPTFLGVFGTTLMWLNSGSNTIRKFTPGGAATMVYAYPSTGPTDPVNGFTASPDGSVVYFSDKSWPDFDEHEIDAALALLPAR